MGLFDGCVLACDIDGTLLANGYLNPRNLEKIEFFLNEGGHFSLSTGRTAGALKFVLEKLSRVSPSVVGNGCMIYDFNSEKVIYELTLDREDYIIAKWVNELGLDVGIEIHAGKEVFMLHKNFETDDHQSYEGMTAKLLSFEEASKYSWNKVLYAFSNLDDLKKVKELISNTENNSYFIDTSATLYGRSRIYYEQIPKGVSKFSALKKLCEVLNIKKGGLFAMGDYYNDLEMLKNADISAVPKGTPDDIAQYADFVGGTCKDGAVADFIDYLTNQKTQSERKDKMDAKQKKELQITACKVRMGIIEGVHAAKSGHPGGSLSIAEIMTYLYFKAMNIDPKNPQMASRDRFVLSKGHAAPALYAALAEKGFFSPELMKTLRHPDSILQGHPDMKNVPGVDMSTGSLGQGVSAAVGMALSAKHFGDTYKVYSVLGDGEIEEGQVWEAAMFAANKGLSNLTVFVDLNNLQIDGTIEEVNSAKPVDKKFEAFNWHTITIDGHDFQQIEDALKEAETVDKPVAIIATTIKGKGVSFMEDAVGWHGVAPNDEQYEQAMTELKASLAELQN